MRGAKVPRIFLLGPSHRNGEQANTALFTAFYSVFLTALSDETQIATHFIAAERNVRRRLPRSRQRARARHIKASAAGARWAERALHPGPALNVAAGARLIISGTFVLRSALKPA